MPGAMYCLTYLPNLCPPLCRTLRRSSCHTFAAMLHRCNIGIRTTNRCRAKNLTPNSTGSTPRDFIHHLCPELVISWQCPLVGARQARTMADASTDQQTVSAINIVFKCSRLTLLTVSIFSIEVDTTASCPALMETGNQIKKYQLCLVAVWS